MRTDKLYTVVPLLAILVASLFLVPLQDNATLVEKVPLALEKEVALDAIGHCHAEVLAAIVDPPGNFEAFISEFDTPSLAANSSRKTILRL